MPTLMSNWICSFISLERKKKMEATNRYVFLFLINSTIQRSGIIWQDAHETQLILLFVSADDVSQPLSWIKICFFSASE